MEPDESSIFVPYQKAADADALFVLPLVHLAGPALAASRNGEALRSKRTRSTAFRARSTFSESCWRAGANRAGTSTVLHSRSWVARPGARLARKHSRTSARSFT